MAVGVRLQDCVFSEDNVYFDRPGKHLLGFNGSRVQGFNGWKTMKIIVNMIT